MNVVSDCLTEVREEKGEEEEEAVYINADTGQGSGSQEATGDQGTVCMNTLTLFLSPYIITAACHPVFKVVFTDGYNGHAINVGPMTIKSCGGKSTILSKSISTAM